jgi:glycosyltransferase involved in cell wall biosynthesis
VDGRGGRVVVVVGCGIAAMSAASVDAVVVVAHKYVTQPDDELVLYLNSTRAARVLHICHSFSDAPDRRSLFRLYCAGELVRTERSADFKSWPEPLVYVKEMIFTLWWTLRHGGARWDLFVGMDGLCVLWGNLLRMLGRVRKTVYWAMDFVPRDRFASRTKNAVYASVNAHGYRHADEVWDLSPRMAQAREELGGISPADCRRNVLVPYGVWRERIPHFSYEECERDTLVFMGHLLEKQGVQLAIRAIPRIVGSIPGFRFKIVGGGSYRSELEALAVRLGVAERCLFLGRIERIEDLEREVALGAAAIAPYIRSLDTWTVYADPGKVKTYLACGVPVLLTDVPWNAESIAREGCGVIIGEDIDDIATQVVRVMEPETNRRMRARALQFARGFEWPAIFAAALGPAPGARGPAP